MKHVFMVFVVLSTLVRGNIIETRRGVFTHEIMDVSLSNESIKLKGWGILQNKHHFKDSKTHQYRLKFDSDDTSFTVDGKSWNADLTSLMGYRGYNRCTDLQRNRDDCNYDFKNVGFEFTVPLDKFKVGSSYTISLILDSLVEGNHYESTVHYFTQNDVSKQVNQKIYQLNTDAKTASFSVFQDNVVVRSKPYENPETPTVNYDLCSNAYGKASFYTKHSVFKNIKSVIQNGLVKSYEVGVKFSKCDGYRNRVLEGSTDTGYMQSVFVDYKSKPLTLTVIAVRQQPKIEAEDVSVNQYTDFNAKKYVEAFDENGSLDLDPIQVYINEVNTRIPGQYDVVYRYRELEKAIVVTVKPVDVVYRYVNSKTEGQLKLWKYPAFKALFQYLMKQK